MDGWMDGCTDVRRCIDVWMYGCVDVWMYGCMDVWMYGCMDVKWLKLFGSRDHTVKVDSRGAELLPAESSHTLLSRLVERTLYALACQEEQCDDVCDGAFSKLRIMCGCGCTYVRTYVSGKGPAPHSSSGPRSTASRPLPKSTAQWPEQRPEASQSSRPPRSPHPYIHHICINSVFKKH